jgi:hypothetical protein
MLARFFKKSEPISLISLIFLLFVYTIIQAFKGVEGDNSLQGVLSFFGVFLLLSFFLFLEEFIIRKNRLTPLNYYAIFGFVILIGFFPQVISFSKIGFSNLFIYLALRRIYSLQTKKELLLKLFDSGFYIGISFLLYPVSLLFFILIYVGYFIYIKIISKDLLLPVIGFITPIFITFAYYFFIDDLASFKTLVEINIGFTYQKYLNTSFILPAIYVLFFLIWALFVSFSHRNSLGNDGKSSFNLVLTHLLLSIIVINVYNLQIERSVLYVFFPISVLLGKLFSYLESYRIKDVLLYGFVIFSFVLLYLGFTENLRSTLM